MIPAPVKGMGCRESKQPTHKYWFLHNSMSSLLAIKAHAYGYLGLSKGQGTTKQSVLVLRIVVGHIKLEIDFVTDCRDTRDLGRRLSILVELAVFARRIWHWCCSGFSLSILKSMTFTMLQKRCKICQKIANVQNILIWWNMTKQCPMICQICIYSYFVHKKSLTEIHAYSWLWLVVREVSHPCSQFWCLLQLIAMLAPAPAQQICISKDSSSATTKRC